MGQTVAAAEAEQSTAADPLDGALPAGGPAVDGQADDLLSQLAGAEIDRMLAEADVEPAPPPPPPVMAVAAAASPAVAAVPPPVEMAAISTPPTPAPAVLVPAPAAAADLDAVLSAAARPAATPSARSAPLDLGDPVARLPLLLRPLALLNAPLDPYPDRVRDAVGKVAVVTLVNAVAVISYVAIFRRHG